MAQKPRSRVERGTDGRFYVYKETDVSEDANTTESKRFVEMGVYDNEEQAAKAQARL